MAFTEQDPQVQDLMKAQPGWSSQDAMSWANRYYPAQPPAAGGAPPGTVALGNGGVDPYMDKAVDYGNMQPSDPSKAPMSYGNDNVQRQVAQAPAPAAPDPSMGGGTMTPQQAIAAGLGWVPVGHPLYGTPGYVGSSPASGGQTPMPNVPVGNAGAAGYTPPNAAPGTPATTNVATQNQNAQTYSQTPGAAPSNATTNQGTQDVLRNQYLQTIQKGTNVDTQDPMFRMQADAFGAAQERARRNAIDDSVQSNFSEGMHGSGAENIERRMADETSARNQGQFEAGLVGQELQSRRDEIQQALQSLGGMINSDQAAALQRELASLDADLKRESLAQTGQLGNADINLRDRLGTGALNVDSIRALLGNQNFNDNLGFNAANAAVQNYLRANKL